MADNATDLAATLHGLAEASVDFPAECQDRLWDLLPAIATALERGAAAEAVTERVRWEGEHDYGIGSELRGLIAAYEGLANEWPADDVG